MSHTASNLWHLLRTGWQGGPPSDAPPDAAPDAPAQPDTDTEDAPVPIWHVCFVTGAGAGLVGMGLGIAMGLAKDFALTPVHAHINLLGWVCLMLYGLYYRAAPRPAGRLAWTQVSMAVVGFVAMTGGLWLLLTDRVPGIAQPVVIVGSLMTIGSMALFLAVVLRDALRPRRADTAR